MYEPHGSNAETPTARERAWIGPLCFLLALIVLLFFRLHAWDLPLETDECNYAYIGARLLEGQRLYVDVWDHQPFGVFALFAGAIALFGDGPEVFRGLALLFSIASMGLIFAILRRDFGLLAAVSGAFMFAVTSSDPGTAGEGCNREIYMNTFILVAWYLLSLRRSAPNATVFGAGIALALGSAIKTILAIHWAFMLAYLLVAVWREEQSEKSVRQLFKTLVLFAVGPAAFWLAALGYFAATNRAHEFMDAAFLFNLSYAGGAQSFWSRFVDFFAPRQHPFIFDSALPLWIVGLIASLGLAVCFGRRGKTRTRLIIVMVLSSFLAVCLPGKSWPHYYYLLIPPLIIAIAAATHEIAVALKKRFPSADKRLALLFAVVPILLGWTEYRDYLSQPLFGVTVKRYNSRDFWGRAMGEKIRRVTEPNDTIFVFGSDTGVYYYSDRRCASRYTMITGLSSGYKGVDQRRKILLQELRRNLPRIILILFDEQPFEGWLALLNEYYETIGGDHQDRSGEWIMFVYGLKAAPVEAIDWEWDREEVGGW
ncbi:MAG: glycosyltransferase family 39 protein, partial [Phycisphaerales bacterium]